MNDKDAERIMAYYDNELAEEDKASVEHLLSQDIEAKQFFDNLSQADQVANQYFNDLLEQPVPERLIMAAQGKKATSLRNDNVVAFQKPVIKQQKYWLYATAASVLLTVGLVSNDLFNGKSNINHNASFASLMSEALESLPSGQQKHNADGSVTIMPVASFDTEQQGFCREYAGLRDGQQISGLACRGTDKQWHSVIETQMSSIDANSHVPAEGEQDLISQTLLDLGVEQALPYGKEQSLLQQHWIK